MPKELIFPADTLFMQNNATKGAQDNSSLYTLGKTRKLGKRPATRIDAARMLKRRLKDAGLSDAFSPFFQSYRNYELPRERRNAGSGTADRRPRRQPNNEAL
jgi:hypothetical protein